MSHTHAHYPVSVAVMDIPNALVVGIGVGLLCATLRSRFSWHSRSYYDLTAIGSCVIVASTVLMTIHKLVAATSGVNLKFMYDQYLVLHGAAFITMAWAAALFVKDRSVYVYRGVVLGPHGELPSQLAGSATTTQVSSAKTTQELQPLTAHVDEDDDDDGDGDGGQGAGAGASGTGQGDTETGLPPTDDDPTDGGDDVEARRAARRVQRRVRRLQRRRMRVRRSTVWVVGPPLGAVACLLVISTSLWTDTGVWGKGPATEWRIVTAVCSVMYACLMAGVCRCLRWKLPMLSYLVAAVFALIEHITAGVTKGYWPREVTGYGFTLAWTVANIVFWRMNSVTIGKGGNLRSALDLLPTTTHSHA